jgi:hypothetical protein
MWKENIKAIIANTIIYIFLDVPCGEVRIATREVQQKVEGQSLFFFLVVKGQYYYRKTGFL